MKEHAKAPVRLLALGAMVVGVAGGTYGIAAAATGSSSSTTATTSVAAITAAPAAAPSPSMPWGGQRSDETVLTGDAATKVEAIAKAKVAGGTIVRVETDADGNATYEAHMTNADGTPVSVYVDKDFNFDSVETR